MSYMLHIMCSIMHVENNVLMTYKMTGKGMNMFECVEQVETDGDME